MSDKNKNSFRDMILIVLVVLICFGATVYGIVYLTGKIFGSGEKIEIAKVRPPVVSTDPEEGDTLIFSSEPSKTVKKETDNTSGGSPKPLITPSEKVGETSPSAGNEKLAASGAPRAPEKNTMLKPATRPDVQKPSGQSPPKKNADKSTDSVLRSEREKGAYVVQIMSVKSKTVAEKEAEKYGRSCPRAYVQTVNLGPEKGTWYRVRCGDTNSKSEAIRTRDDLKAKYKIKPEVMPNK